MSSGGFASTRLKSNVSLDMLDGGRRHTKQLSSHHRPFKFRSHVCRRAPKGIRDFVSLCLQRVILPTGDRQYC